MDFVLAVIVVLGGAATFVYGLKLLGEGTEKLVGAKLKKFVAGCVEKPFGGFLAGAAVAGVTQSSAAVTMVAVGLAEAGAIKNKTLKNVGDALVGFGLMLSGLSALSGRINALKSYDFLSGFAYVDNPFLLFLFGALQSFLPRGWMKYIVKGSAVLVVTLGLSMLVKGIRLFGM